MFVFEINRSLLTRITDKLFVLLHEHTCENVVTRGLSLFSCVFQTQEDFLITKYKFNVFIDLIIDNASQTDFSIDSGIRDQHLSFVMCVMQTYKGYNDSRVNLLLLESMKLVYQSKVIDTCSSLSILIVHFFAHLDNGAWFNYMIEHGLITIVSNMFGILTNEFINETYSNPTNVNVVYYLISLIDSIIDGREIWTIRLLRSNILYYFYQLENILEWDCEYFTTKMAKKIESPLDLTLSVNWNQVYICLYDIFVYIHQLEIMHYCAYTGSSSYN